MLHFLELWKRERERIGIERDMEAKPFALYGERCPNTTQFFCFDGVSEWVSVYFHATTVCQKTPYPVILYVQWCKRKIIGCLASSVILSSQCLPNPTREGESIYICGIKFEFMYNMHACMPWRHWSRELKKKWRVFFFFHKR